MNPEDMMDGLIKEINSTLKLMGKAKKPEDKLVYSEILKNLASSFGEIIGVVKSMMPPDFLDDDWDDDWDDDDDDETIPF
jgi:hypothetical protein